MTKPTCRLVSNDQYYVVYGIHPSSISANLLSHYKWDVPLLHPCDPTLRVGIEMMRVEFVVI